MQVAFLLIHNAQFAIRNGGRGAKYCNLYNCIRETA